MSVSITFTEDKHYRNKVKEIYRKHGVRDLGTPHFICHEHLH